MLKKDSLGTWLSVLFIVLGTKNAYGLVGYHPGPFELLSLLVILVCMIASPIGALVLIKAKSKSRRMILGVCTVVCIFAGVLAAGGGLFNEEIYAVVFGLPYLAIGLFSRWVHKRTR